MCVVRKHLEGRPQPALSQHRGMDPAGKFSELVDGALKLNRCIVQQLLRFGWVLLELELGQPEGQRE